MTIDHIRLGCEIGSAEAVDIPLRHLAVTGQTQEAGKTTALEGLVSRSGATAIAFVTKRGESSFGGARRIQPYFRDRADWQFVTSIIDATLQEKNKFLRPWIMKICRATKTLADVQAEVRRALKKAKGINEGVYTQLDAYLDLIVPEIGRATLAPRLELRPGLNVMDVSSSPTPMQMLFVQSAIDWINEHERNTIVVIPEAWEFVPEGRGSPVKASAVALARKGAGVGNYLWIDSQDMAGVDKTLLRACAVWLIGVQREANEIKRNLANIPASVKHPSAADVAMLGKGQFFACWGQHCIKTYAQPAWLGDMEAQGVARGLLPISLYQPPIKETAVSPEEASALRRENETLKGEVADLRRRLEALTEQRRPSADVAPQHPAPKPLPVKDVAPPAADFDVLYEAIKSRLAVEAPRLIRVLAEKPEIEVAIERQKVEIDGASIKGRIARLLADGFYDAGKTNSATRKELARTGSDANNANISRVLDELVSWGFLTREAGDSFTAVAGMKVNIVEA